MLVNKLNGAWVVLVTVLLVTLFTEYILLDGWLGLFPTRDAKFLVDILGNGKGIFSMSSKRTS